MPQADAACDLVLAFGTLEDYQVEAIRNQIKSSFPNAQIIGCTTAGIIQNDRVVEQQLTITAISFTKTKIETAFKILTDGSDSYQTGIELAKELPHDNLSHLFLISEGLSINGSQLLKGIAESLPSGIKVTGGLAGDGIDFENTQVWLNDEFTEKLVAAVGFYGTDLKVNFGSVGGSHPFGPEREVTDSEANILKELDGEPALSLYKKYLGDEFIQGLPASAQLFPLFVMDDAADGNYVRSILAVDHDTGYMTFAGDIPKGTTVRLMKSSIEGLIEGAEDAAVASQQDGNSRLAILVSCVGRKMVMDQRVEEEIEAVKKALGEDCLLAGFYSYGEICPHGNNHEMALHNLTMTVTSLYEV